MMTSCDQISKWKDQACSAIDRRADELREIGVYLHDNPEVAWCEVKAAERLSNYLEGLGFLVQRGIGGIPTAFRAVLDSNRPGPRIAVLAEYDALPGIGHGCGHNLIAASAVGAAASLLDVLPQLGGRIIVMGTPAEEFSDHPQAKIPLLRGGEFAGVDVCLMLHPWTSFAPINSSLAFCALDIIFHGRTSHASSDPWNGLNALDGVLLTFNHINALRQHVQPDVRMHGIITDGGIVPNIIPERAACRFMLRAQKKERVSEVLAKVKAGAQGAATATGTTVEVLELSQVADTLANTTLQALTRANFERLGISFGDAVEWTASTDYGDVSYKIPSESFFISLGVEDVPWHSTEVAAASISAPALEGMLIGAKVLAMDAVDLLAQPALVQQAKAGMPAD